MIYSQNPDSQRHTFLIRVSYTDDKDLCLKWPPTSKRQGRGARGTGGSSLGGRRASGSEKNTCLNSRVLLLTQKKEYTIGAENKDLL